MVPGRDPGVDVGLQGVDAGMDTTLEQLGGEFGEPALDLVQPRGTGRDEMQVEPWVATSQRWIVAVLWVA